MKSNTERNEKILALRRSGATYPRIADELGLTLKTVEHVIGNTGIKLGWTDESRTRSASFKENMTLSVDALADRYDIPYDFVSRTPGKYGTVTLRCRKCGELIMRSIVTIRMGGALKCERCTEIARTEKREREEQEKEHLAEARAAERAKKEKEKAEKITPVLATCKICGEQFETIYPTQLYCSKKCRQRNKTEKRSDKTKGQGSKHRVPKMQRLESGINIYAVFRKDGGICYLCGKPCDWNDFEISKTGYPVFGDLYPSVEHVIPVAKGGTHSEDNVRLAHRICNSIKRDL